MIKIAFAVLAVVTVLLAVATLGGDWYASWFMIALWTALCALTIAVIVRKHKQMRFFTISLHLSFIIILIGAAITHFTAREEVVEIHCGQTLTEPLNLRLDDSFIEYYPGTASASDYVSILSIDGSEPQRLSMNKIITHRGWRMFQTAIGDGYSVLTLTHDPWGTGVTYGGYALLFLSMALVLIKRRHSLLALAFLTAMSSMAAPRTLQKPLAENFGNLLVEWNGRVVPVQTLAREFTLKVHGSADYEGLTAEQVLCGYLFYYDDWKHEPIIKVKSAEARRLMGLEGKYASLSDYFDGPTYKLEESLRQNLNDRGLQDADEKLQLVSMAVTGRLLKIHPDTLPDGSTEWSAQLDMLNGFAREVAHGRFIAANDTLSNVIKAQRSLVPHYALPSEAKIKAEKLYNQCSGTLWMAIVLIIAAIVTLTGLTLLTLDTFVAVGILAWLSVLIGLRWYISGHVPLSDGFETMQAMAWLSLLIALWRKSLRPMAMLVAALALLVAMMSQHNPTVGHLIPVLASPLLSVHVLLVMSAYALLAIMAINSAIGLCRKSHMPSAAESNRRLLIPAVFLLCAGIFVGAIWANQSWGRYWGWDPKETWALITMIVYAYPIHRVSLPCFRSDRWLNGWCLGAFLTVLMTYFGVNFFLPGLHSYAA